MNSKQLIGTVLDVVVKIIIVVAMIMFTYKYTTEAYDFGYRVFAEEPISSEETARTVSFAVVEDATAKDIGEDLEKKGLIADAKLFYVQERLSKYHDELKPGIYELNSGMTSVEMMAVMASSQEEGTENLDSNKNDDVTNDNALDMDEDDWEDDWEDDGNDTSEEGGMPEESDTLDDSHTPEDNVE